MHEKSSCPSWARWRQYVEDTLPAAEQAELSAHLDHCADCRKTLDSASGGDSLLLAARDVGRQQIGPPGVAAVPAAAGSGLDFLAPPGKPGSLGRLGHYDILAEIGRGGMGLVLRAFDEALHRVVAIKVLPPEWAGNASARKRFLREARAAAAVRHDHIIDIHAVGDQPLPHLVMEYVAGQNLQQKLDHVGPLELKEVLRIGYQVASGLATAHTQGLIHRDVKPSNILLENGVERVKLTDFGLARAVDDASVTQSGVIAGTPHYMSPEQAEGRTLDQRSDLFSLGSVLYVMCTGRLPFRAGTTLAVLKRVCEDTPRPVRDICGEVPEWLAAIIGKLHAKQPQERFQSAQEVAELLAKYLAELQVHGTVRKGRDEGGGMKDEKGTSLPSSLLPHLSSLSRLLLGAVSALGLTALLLLWLNWPSGSVPPGPGEEKANQPTPKRPLSLEEQRRLPSPLDQWKRQDIPPARLALAGGGDPEQAPPELVAVFGEDQAPAPVLAVAVSPDGRTLAAGYEHTVRLWDLAAGKQTRLLSRHADVVDALAFSPDGTLLASASADTTIVLWDLATGKEVRTLSGHSRKGSLIAFSPDGKTLAAGAEDGSVKLWDVATGKPKEPLRWHTGPVRAVAFSPDGTLLASGGQDQTVQVCEADTGRRHTFQTDTAVTNLAFADGQTLAATCDVPNTRLRVWDLATLKEIMSPAHAAGVLGLACQPGSRLAATGAADGKVRFWDLAAAPLRSLFLPPGPCGAKVHALAFTPEGRYLATANDNGTLTILRVPEPPGTYQPGPAKKLPDPLELAKEPNPADALRRQDIPPALLARAGGGDKDKAPAELVAVLAAGGLTKQVTTVTFSPDGKTLAWAGNDRTVVLWDLVAGKLRATLAGHDENIQSVTFSPDGKTLASAGGDRVIRLWDVAKAKAVRALTGHRHTICQLAFSPDGRWLASTSQDATVRLWSAGAGTLERTFLGLACANAAAFSPDSKYLMAESASTRVALWDAASGWELASLPGHGSEVRCLALHPGGRMLLVATAGYPIKLWDLGTLQLRHTLLDDFRGAWRADGGLLASVGASDGTLRLWDLTASPPRSVAIPLFPAGPHSLLDVTFSPEGRYLATANHDGTVYLLKLAGPGEVYHLPTD